jgi:hypothetical protein
MAITVSVELLRSFATETINDIRQSMDDSGVTASGKFNRSLKADITPNSLVITGSRYAGAIELGRKPTSSGGAGVLRGLIRQWIDDKGITPTGNISKDSLAYLITRKIHQQGTALYRGSDHYGRSKPSRVISGVLEDGRVEKLAKSVVLDVISQFRSELFKG